MTEERVRGFSLRDELAVRIADDSQTWFKCQLCGVVDEQLISAPCQHTFCHKCVDENNILKCPVHHTCYSPSQLTFNPSINDSLHQLEVYCLQKECGCSRKLKLQDLARHLATCGFVRLNCPCDCGHKICRKQLAHHLTHDCDNRLISCVYCEEEISYKDENEHLESCPKKPVLCQFCRKQFINDQVEMHSQQCSMRPVPCDLAQAIGCCFQGNSQELETHRKDVEVHLSLAIRKISEFEDTKREITCLTEDIASIKKQSQYTRNEVVSLVKELRNTRSSVQKTEQDVNSFLKELQANKTQIQETKEEIASLTADVTSAKNEIQGLSEVRNSILKLDRERNAVNEAREKEMKKVKDDIAQILKEITSLKNSLQRTTSPNEEHKPNNSYKRGNYRVSSPPTKL